MTYIHLLIVLNWCFHFFRFVTLLQGDKFQQYKSQFPETVLNTTMEAYPLLKNKLKTELSYIHSND